MGVSLINAVPEELIYASLRGIKVLHVPIFVTPLLFSFLRRDTI